MIALIAFVLGVACGILWPRLRARFAKKPELVSGDRTSGLARYQQYKAGL